MPPMTLQQAFELALGHHQFGRLAEAETIYRQVLAAEPRQADALHMLGVLAHQMGRNDVAAELIGQAIAAAPGVADFHSNLGDHPHPLRRGFLIYRQHGDKPLELVAPFVD